MPPIQPKARFPTRRLQPPDIVYARSTESHLPASAAEPASGFRYDTFMSATPTAGTTSQSIMDLERDYLLQNYARYPIVIHRGKGCHVYDVDGNRYLDFISGIGVNALGHAHPRIVKVIRDQAALLMHSSNLYYHEFQGPLAKKLAEISGLAALVLLQQRHRSHGRRAQNGCAPTATKSIAKNTRSSRWTIPFTAAPWARCR